MVRFKPGTLLGLLALLAACAAPVPTVNVVPSPTALPCPATSTPPVRAFRIVGYVGDTDAVVASLPFDHLTHINYAFLLPRADGTVGDVANPWKLTALVTQAHVHQVQVLISVGGWGYDEQFEALAATPEGRATFVAGLNDFVGKYRLDGVDIDWEYPGPAAESAQNYLVLMTALSETLHPQGKLLTAAVVAAGDNANGVLPEVFPQVDFLNLMAYDGPGRNHASYEYAVEALDAWSARGLPPEQMVLGVPFYARPQEVTYRELIQLDPAAAQADEWNYYGTTVYYNGIPTLRAKTALARQRASGLMIWALQYDTQDETSLLNAIYHAAYGP